MRGEKDKEEIFFSECVALGLIDQSRGAYYCAVFTRPRGFGTFSVWEFRQRRNNCIERLLINRVSDLTW